MAKDANGRHVDITEVMQKCVQEDREVLETLAKLDQTPKSPAPSAQAPIVFKYKQVIVVRSDLALTKGKTAVQVAHAAIAAAEETKKSHPDWYAAWLQEGQRKIALKVKDEGTLVVLNEKANQAHIPAAMIRDFGLTEIPPNTVTCIGLGPAPSEMFDELTSSLALL